MTDVDTGRTPPPPAAAPAPADPAMSTLLQLAAAANRYVAAVVAGGDMLTSCVQRRHLELVLDRAWDVLGTGRRPAGANQAVTLMPIYAAAQLPDDVGWGTYAKVAHTVMARMPGPFATVTIDGNVASCQDGYLALDSDGHPYPVAASQADDYRLIAEIDAWAAHGARRG